MFITLYQVPQDTTKMKKMKFFAILYITIALGGLIGCGDIAPIVVPEEAYEDPTSGEPGTQNLQVSAVYRAMIRALSR